jgi:calmodulin-regulated spectrin-associated protein
MNCDLHDIQDDIQKLAKQQNQIQVQAMQAQQLFQAQQIANILNQQYSSQQNIAGLYHPIQQQFGSTPHLPMKPPHHQYVNEQGQYINQQIYSRENSRIDDQYSVTSPPTQYLNQEKQRNIAKYVQETNNYRDQFDTQQAQFFLHQSEPQTPPQPPARRTWSQKAPAEMSSWSQQAQIQQHQIYQQQQQFNSSSSNPGSHHLPRLVNLKKDSSFIKMEKCRKSLKLIDSFQFSMQRIQLH